MRVSSCNCHYPLVCCSKSSVLYNPPCPPQKPQCGDAPNASLSSAPVPVVLEEEPPDAQKAAIEQNGADGEKVEILLKSSLKKPRAPNSEQVGKGNVKWMDLSGKELVEIKEFESIESEETEDYTDGSVGCICVIQ